MANWFITESQALDSAVQRTAGTKARDDLEAILMEMGWNPLNVSYGVDRFGAKGIVKTVQGHIGAAACWRHALRDVSAGDVVLVQLPAVNHTIGLARVLKKCKARGVSFIAVLHDLESVRFALKENASLLARRRVAIEESGPLRLCDAVIAHNGSMADLLSRRLGADRSRIVELGVFDYLVPEGKLSQANFDVQLPVVICGTLRRHKAGYAYGLPDNPKFNLYGVDYTGRPQDNVAYHGSFPADELSRVICGSFGLVWDGDSARTCSGAYGDYLRVNNPHKTSMYLSLGLPVAIWREAALAPFIVENGAGVAIDSLHDLHGVLQDMRPEDYEAMKEAAADLGERLRAGYYAKRAVAEAVGRLR